MPKESKRIVSRKKIALIYNPQAGLKRRLFTFYKKTPITLEYIQSLLEQYGVYADPFPTERAGHATELAKKLAKHYKLVIAAGGDGTISEVANGLIGSNTSLAILPLGSFMNIARMLCVPTDLEKAIMLIKIGKVEKIDVGKIQSLAGKRLRKPYYFLESTGVGIDAQFQKDFLSLERGNLKSFFKLIKSWINYYGSKVEIILDKTVINSWPTMVTIANAPYTGAQLPIAPEAKLNDHHLTVTIYETSKSELFFHFFKLFFKNQPFNKNVTTYKAKNVSILSKKKNIVHADAQLFSKTPLKCTVVPNALKIVTGFSRKNEPSALINRTYLHYALL